MAKPQTLEIVFKDRATVGQVWRAYERLLDLFYTARVALRVEWSDPGFVRLRPLRWSRVSDAIAQKAHWAASQEKAVREARISR